MSKQVQEAYVIDALRTPVGKAPRGMFRNTRPDDLLAHCLRKILARYPQIDAKEIDDAIIGCAMPEAEQGMNVARIAVLLAGLPEDVAAVTVNRFCSSGLQTVAMAADRIRLGEVDLMLAGGTETMSMVPMMGHRVTLNPDMFRDENVAIAYGMGITAEKVAERWDISREAQDEFAAASHAKALAGIENGWWKAEIEPFPLVEHWPDLHSGAVREVAREVDTDEGPRPGTTAETLAKLRTVFRSDGSVTAGNSSQMSDGAGIVLLASEAAVKRYNLTPKAVFRGYAVAGVAPDIMGIGPIKAIPKVLEQTGLTFDDMDWVELNEAFAAQSLAVIKELDLDTKNINPLGGAIALGHPLGATGTVRVCTMLHGLERTGGKYGMVTMCVGTGMGAAGIFERIN